MKRSFGFIHVTQNLIIRSFCWNFQNRTFKAYHRKNQQIPIFGYFGVFLRIPTKIPNLEEWDKSQLGNLVGNSLVGTCLTLPNLGFLWVFFKYPKISNVRNLSFFLVLYRAESNSCWSCFLAKQT